MKKSIMILMMVATGFFSPGKVIQIQLFQGLRFELLRALWTRPGEHTI